MLRIGSDKLKDILELVTEEVNTPAVDLINLGIDLTYTHKLNTDEVSKKSKSKDYSKTAKQIINYQIIRYALLNKLTYADIQRIENLLDDPKRGRSNIPPGINN